MVIGESAEHDRILGDAYEYLMRHFASESGKSKRRFYTPSEVSGIIAKVIGIAPSAGGRRGRRLSGSEGLGCEVFGCRPCQVYPS
jgi:type I restriction-modification system DNA methylase subunit